jgi:predicted HTH domain antitoxin
MVRGAVTARASMEDQIMSVQFDLPADIERRLRAQFANLDAAAKEAALVELYRQSRLTHYELAQAMGVSRLETDTLLRRHGVTEDLMTVEEFRQELRALGRGDE